MNTQIPEPRNPKARNPDTRLHPLQHIKHDPNGRSWVSDGTSQCMALTVSPTSSAKPVNVTYVAHAEDDDVGDAPAVETRAYKSRCQQNLRL